MSTQELTSTTPIPATPDLADCTFHQERQRGLDPRDTQPLEADPDPFLPDYPQVSDYPQVYGMTEQTGPGVITTLAHRPPAIGDEVFYVMDSGPNVGEVRPATIVRVWNSEYVNLQVLTDGSNDGPQYSAGLTWATSIPFSTTRAPRTWHYRNASFNEIPATPFPLAALPSIFDRGRTE